MKKLFFLAAAATIALSSCVKNDTVYTDAQTPMEFKAFNVASTKAPIEGTTFEQNISVFAVYNNSGKAYFPETTFAKNTTGVWSGQPARYWPTTGKMDFAAYSPADAGDATPTYATVADGGSISKISVVCPDNDAADQKDIIYGNLLNDIVCPQTAPVAMQFHHALAQIVLKVKQGVAATADTYQITVKKVTLNNLVLGGTLDITPAATSTIGWSSKNAAVAYEVDATNHVLTTDYTALKGVLVVPSDQTSVTIVYDITVDGNTNEVEQTVNLNTSTTTEADKWEAGKKYTYNININLKEIEFAPVVEPWVDAPEKDITIE